MSIVSENEGVAGTAVASLFTSNSQASAASVVGESGGEFKTGIDLVVEDSREVVVETGFHGGVDFTASPVGAEFFRFDGSV